MKTHPCELRFHKTTATEFAQTIVDGGWIESWEFCHIIDCDEPRPHRHYICKSGHLDFTGRDTCFWCWHMSELHKARHMLLRFREEHGESLLRTGFCLAVLLAYTIANMGVR